MKRLFLTLVVFAMLAATFMVACQPKIVEVTKIVKETVAVEKKVEVTKVVEKEKVVEKIVKETVVVEKEKVVEKIVTATDRPSPTPTRTSTPTTTSQSFSVVIEVRGIEPQERGLLKFCFLDRAEKGIACFDGYTEEVVLVRKIILSREPFWVRIDGTPEGRPWDKYNLLGGRNPIPISVGQAVVVVEFAPIAPAGPTTRPLRPWPTETPDWD